MSEFSLRIIENSLKSKPFQASRDEYLAGRLRDQIDAALRTVISTANEFALLDFPHHANVGDSAIWLGELAWLRACSYPAPAYVCTLADYSPDDLRAAVPQGPILLHGGGNFGDIWPAHQAFRERVCQEFPDRKIIQLPQSVHFSDPGQLARARAVIDNHPAFMLLVRDQESLKQVRSFNCHIALCPDLAFYLDSAHPAVRPRHPLLALMRTDKEQVAHNVDVQSLLAQAHVVDWIAENKDAIEMLKVRVEQAEGREESFRRIAEYRLARGLAILASGDIIVTDRLHGHILSILLGRDHFLLDNSYHKIERFVDSWTSSLLA